MTLGIMKKILKKRLFLWSLYDFGNSIIWNIFFLYISQWLVIDIGVSDFWFNFIFVGSTILLLVTAPVFGIIVDKNRKWMWYLKVSTFLQFACFLIFSLLALNGYKEIVPLVLLLIGANYFYNFAFTFYNPLLRFIGPERKHGFISGIGQMANWLGEILGVFIALPLALGAIYLFGEPGRVQTFLPGTTLFILFSMPMLIRFNVSEEKPTNVKASFVKEFLSLKSSLSRIIKYPHLGRFLLAYFFFNDAIITVSNNFAIYLERVFQFPDDIKSYILLGILTTSAIGAILSGWLGDKIGMRKAMLVVLIGWTILLPVISLTSDPYFFSFLCILVGLFFGSTWSVTRGVMAYLSPQNELNHAFSYYTIFERFASITGPLLWGIITSLTFLGVYRYNLAVLSMTVFLVLGLIIIWKIPEKNYVR